MNTDEKEELLKRYKYKIEMRNKYISRINKEIQVIRDMLQVNCDHPQEFVKDYLWEWDDGYGHQEVITGSKCRICNKKDPWNKVFKSK